MLLYRPFKVAATIQYFLYIYNKVRGYLKVLLIVVTKEVKLQLGLSVKGNILSVYSYQLHYTYTYKSVLYRQFAIEKRCTAEFKGKRSAKDTLKVGFKFNV